MRNHEPIYFAPQRKADGSWRCFKDSPSPPPAPDYTGAAQATAAGNAQAAQQAQQANLVNQNTPYGSLTYSQDPTSRFSSGNPSYSANINLNETGQKLLDYSNQSALGLGALQGGATQQVANTMGQPMDLSSVQKISDQSYADQTARLDPQWAQNKQQFDSQMANQGITAGGEAYDNAARDFGQQRNDAYTQARQAALSTMPQTYQLASAAYNQPLNALNALRTGSQVTNPTFGSTPQQQTTTGPNYLGAAQAQSSYNQGMYNSGVGQANSFNSGLFQLGAAAFGAPTGTFTSDRRLKRDIVKVSDDPRGFGWYSFRYLWSEKPQIGVMADEVPHAAILHPSGFLMVDYGRL